MRMSHRALKLFLLYGTMSLSSCMSTRVGYTTIGGQWLSSSTSRTARDSHKL